MKKEYSKPIVVFESFSMSTNIAGDCENKIDNQSKGTCAYFSSGGIALFTAAMVNICDFTASDGKADGFCYHVPEGGPNIFNS
jgi:hypothetical protein